MYNKLLNKKAKLALVGLGYVGLPIALEFAKKISVIGFDNSDTGRVIRPALSTISMDQKAIAQASLELIEAMINGEEPMEKHLITQMVLRETTK